MTKPYTVASIETASEEIASLLKGPASLAVLTGAGVSVESGIPLANDMVAALRMQRGIDSQIEDYPSAMKAAFAEDLAGRGRFLRQQCYGKSAGPTNRALGYLAQRARIDPLFTTNFDHLLEQALLAYGDRPIRVATLGAASFSALRPGDSTYIRVIKLHGDAQYNMTAHVFDEMAYHHTWLRQRAQLAVAPGSGASFKIRSPDSEDLQRGDGA